jgi:periplasmic protein TonB
MRTWTLALSICAHAALVVAVFVAPIFATADLPAPRRPLTFEAITPIATPTIPIPRSQPTQPTQAVQSFPIDEPPDLPINEPTIASAPPDVGACLDCGAVGIPVGIGVVGEFPTAPTPPTPVEPVRIGGNIRAPTRISYTEPVYPRLAIDARKEGVVILEAVLDEEGAVRNVRVLRSIPLLDDAAIHAVSRWKFTPTLLNGAPVPVVMTVTVSFQLSK